MKKLLLFTVAILFFFQPEEVKAQGIGEFKLNNNIRILSTADKYLNEKLDVDSVRIDIIDGLITQLLIFPKKDATCPCKTQFTNTQSPISVRRYNQRSNDKIRCDDDRNIYILAGGKYGLLNWTPTGDKWMYSIDDSIWLKPERKTYTLKTDPLLGLSANVYSDLLGTLGEESNGLVQTEAKVKLLTNTRNIYDSRFLLGQYIEGQFYLSKFDSKYAGTYSGNDSTIDNLSLYQRSPWGVGAKANLVKLITIEGFNLDLSIGYMYKRSNIYITDSIKTDSTKLDTTRLNNSIHSIYAQLSLQYKSKYIETGITPSLILANPIINNELKYLKNLEPQLLFNTSFFLNILLDEEKHNKAFLRFNYFYSFDTKNDFIQLQIGYEKNFSDLLKSIIKKE